MFKNQQQEQAHFNADTQQNNFNPNNHNGYKNRNTWNNRSSNRVNNIDTHITDSDEDRVEHANNMIQNGKKNLPTSTAIIH